MKKIDTLSGLEGRAVLNKIFKELRYEKQASGFSALFTLWKLCVYEQELFRYSKNEVTVMHPLGFFSGTALWLQEIVNRYYYSTINSFVYFGAAILLTLIGVRRFNDNVSDNVVIAGVVFEALMLMLIFIVMLFSPNEINEETTSENGHQESIEELILEVGEISRDFAAVSAQLEQIGDSLQKMIQRQDELIGQTASIAKTNALAVSPNPEMLDYLKETNSALSGFSGAVKNLHGDLDKIRSSEIEFAVKKEIENFIKNKFNNE
jgi:hypothetical protein